MQLCFQTDRQKGSLLPGILVRIQAMLKQPTCLANIFKLIACATFLCNAKFFPMLLINSMNSLCSRLASTVSLCGLFLNSNDFETMPM